MNLRERELYLVEPCKVFLQKGTFELLLKTELESSRWRGEENQCAQRQRSRYWVVCDSPHHDIDQTHTHTLVCFPVSSRPWGKFQKAHIPSIPSKTSLNLLSVLSHRMGIVQSSTSSTLAGLPTGTHLLPSALYSKQSDDWRSGRSSMMGGRDALWSTACEYCRGVSRAMLEDAASHIHHHSHVQPYYISSSLRSQ